jgi:hypothetical protein
VIETKNKRRQIFFNNFFSKFLDFFLKYSTTVFIECNEDGKIARLKMFNNKKSIIKEMS